MVSMRNMGHASTGAQSTATPTAPTDINVDPYAGFVLNEKPVLPLSGENSVISHLVSGASIDPGRDGVITYSFYNAQHSDGWLAAGHYPGYIRDEDGNFISLRGGNGMYPFTPEQEAAARAAIQLWDDLIPVTFKEVNGHGSGTADIIFANSADPAQGFTYYGGSFKGGWDSYLGDVFIADPNINPSNLEVSFGQYGNTTLVHELGHSLGLSHPGEYNYAEDENGNPVPITYDKDAEYFQDSQEYTIMSYFGAWNTGGAPVDWRYSGGVFYDNSPQGPMLHDIVAIQSVYGADPTTRADATTYGFHSTAGNLLYDFNANPLPYYALYDAGGVDTIDLSGFQSSQYLNLNPGVFSSIGDVTMTREQLGEGVHDAYLALGVDLYQIGYTASSLGNLSLGWLAQTKDANAAAIEADTGVSGIGTVNYETFAIAYNTIIENAVGGQGRDLLVGNSANNVLDGQGGDDVLNGGLGNDTLIGGAGSDSFVFANDGSIDTVADFQTGLDKLDLSQVDGATAAYVAFDSTSHQVQIDTNHDGTYDMFIHIQGDSVAAGDYLFHA